MPNGDSTTINSGGSTLPASTPAVVDAFINLSLGDDKVDDDYGGRMSEKDPRKIARKYQLELCNKALEENIIVYLGTGSGKTHIAVLLIHAMGHLIRKPQRNICVFLAPTVALVQQQARVIENSTNFKTGVYCGNSKRLKSLQDWEEEIKKHEVFVMTPQVLLRTLHHCFIKMEFIALLIFDECHHAQVNSNHPYSQIMKVFYETNNTKIPRVFGMTASPVIGKVAYNEGNLSKSINSLESLLDAKIYTVEDRDDLEAFVSSPLVKVYYYDPVDINLSSSFMTSCHKLENIKQQCITMLGGVTASQPTLLSTKKLLCRVHDNIKFCIGSLGLWGALQASQILLSGDQSEWSELIEAEENQNDITLCDKYLAQAAQFFASECGRDLSCVDILKEPFFSKKLLRLVGILTTFRFRPNMKCIVFVNRIVTARSLSFILQNLKSLVYWKCHFLIGVHAGGKTMSRKTLNEIIEKFRSGELNLLVATRVGEEGLDIQTCCLVIRFDIPDTVASFIQSRGRARMPESEYAFLVDSRNQRELDLIKTFGVDEDRINKEVSSRSSSEKFIGSEESIYKVKSSGALITSAYSVSLLHQYCSKLPHDEYFEPKPKFFYFEDLGGTVCHIILPSNAPMHQVVSKPQSSMEAAKKDACLNAIEELHKLGALDDFLLPLTAASAQELDLDPDSCEDDEFGFISDQIYDSREELHEMIVPEALKDPWTDSNDVSLNVYLIKLIPDPNDRIYKDFGLFIKTPLPKEAEEMEVDLHLSHGRSVMVKLITLGHVKLNNDEIRLAENFQEMSLKIMLDRSEFDLEFVPLGRKNTSKSSSSTFYLLLPMIFSEESCPGSIDWEIIRQCLSSPVFSDRMDRMNRESFPSRTQLQLANGCISISAVKNSLVYAPHNKTFFFISDIVYGKNGYSPFSNSDPMTHVEHLIKKFRIYLKCPGQPLLRAKQLFCCRNLLRNRKQEDFEAQHLQEHLIDLPPELCELKIIGFSKEIGSSLSLLPSIMHRLENLLVAVELKHLFSQSFPEGAEVTANRILEALTTENCQERFSLERLEILGDAFLKFAVGRHLFLLHDALGEGELTKKRSDLVNNSNLLKLAISRNLQVYIRDQSFEPSQFYTFGRPSPFVCDEKTIEALHNKGSRSTAVQGNLSDVNCSKRHHWLHNGTISDVVEALVGAFLVDSGFKAAIAFLRWIGIPMKFESLKVHKIWSDSKSYIPLSDSMDIDSLEKSLDYKFIYRGLVLQAFVHPSYTKHGGGCYQRLEFLGDAVLDYLITSYLYSAYPKLKPGRLTDLRSVFVNNEAFAKVAVCWSFHNFLICDSNELRDTVRSYVESMETPAGGTVPLEGTKFPKVLGDLVESCVGAILLDTGFNLNLLWKTMLSFLEQLTRLPSFQLSPLREIQELCQSFNWTCDFKSSKKGNMFFVCVEVNGDRVNATASAWNQSKKEATKTALQSILSRLREQGYISKAAKSLEEALKSSCKMEPRLIGYDEIPMAETAPKTVPLPIVEVNPEPKIQLLRERCSPPLPKTPLNRQPSSDYEASNLCKSTARALLYELCAARHWKPPLFDCVKKEGPSHLRSFIFRAVVQMDETPDMTLEAIGGPHSSKKAAAEAAAQGMLWYLKNIGHLPVHQV